MKCPSHQAFKGGSAVALACALALAACAAGEESDRPPRTSPAGNGGGGEAGGADPEAGNGGGSEAGQGGAGSGGGGGTGATAGAGGTPGRDLPEPDVDAILEAGCATNTERARLLPTNLLFVIDRSSSMACNPPPTTLSADCEADGARVDPFTRSKWEITRAALVEAIDALPEKTVVGISYFSNDDACGVHSVPSVGLAALDDAQHSAIRASLSNVAPGGATPIVGAVILAYRHLHTQALEGAITGNKFVVLLTDGEQSELCADPPRCEGPEDCTTLLIDSEVPKAAGPGVGIKTFAIGAPGSEGAKVVLSRLALAGGTARAGCDADAGDCHFDMTTQASFAEGLSSALEAIAGRTVMNCELSMPEADEIDPTRVNVIYSPGDGRDPEVVPQDALPDCDDGADGWQYSEGQKKIRLCGPACDAVRADSGARLDVVLGCPVRGPD